MKRQSFEERFWSKVDKSGECWIWTGTRKHNGYGEFMTKGDRLAHRISYVLANGPIPAGQYVCHSCDVKPCVNPAHLYLATARQNAQDANAHGLYPTGDRHHARLHPERLARGDRSGARTHPESRAYGSRQGRSKLTDAEVLEIRTLADAGQHSWAALARAFGVGKSNIGAIVTGKTWRHLLPR